MCDEILQMTWKEAKSFVKENPEYKIDGVEENIPLRMLYLIKWVKSTDIVERVLKANTQKEVYMLLQEIPGFARFLAYQIFVDLTYIPEFPFSENEFTISGPGCSLGLDYLFDDKDGMTHEEALFWVRDNIEKEWKSRGLQYDPKILFDHLPEEDQNINIMMLENSFCETSKLTRAKRGEGRPRNGYKPTEPTIEKCKNTLLDF